MTEHMHAVIRKARHDGKTFAAALTVLVAYAEGRVIHNAVGDCAGPVAGPAARSPLCTVCQAIEVVAPRAEVQADQVATE